MPRLRSTIVSNSGHPLSVKEDKFIDAYIELGNARQAVLQAGYNTKAPDQYANTLLKKVYISEEIAYRQSLLRKASIASAEEILEYFSSVMRGEITDQFGLEAPLSERTKAAQELAKRQIDMLNKAGNKEQAEVQITLDWGGIQSVQTISDLQGEDAETETAELATVDVAPDGDDGDGMDEDE